MMRVWKPTVAYGGLRDRGMAVGQERLVMLDLRTAAAQGLLSSLKSRLAAEPHITDQPVSFGMGRSKTSQVRQQLVVGPRGLHEASRFGSNRSPPAPGLAQHHQNVSVATAVPRVMVTDALPPMQSAVPAIAAAAVTAGAD